MKLQIKKTFAGNTEDLAGKFKEIRKLKDEGLITQRLSLYLNRFTTMDFFFNQAEILIGKRDYEGVVEASHYALENLKLMVMSYIGIPKENIDIHSIKNCHGLVKYAHKYFSKRIGNIQSKLNYLTN